MKIPCKHCSSSGIDYVGYPSESSIGLYQLPYDAVPCKYCGGSGEIDEDEIINGVKRKYIKNEFFENDFKS